jgi:hypothetical protein
VRRRSRYRTVFEGKTIQFESSLAFLDLSLALPEWSVRCVRAGGRPSAVVYTVAGSTLPNCMNLRLVAFWRFGVPIAWGTGAGLIEKTVEAEP